ncbi:Protein of unknown function (DUF3549) [Methylophaga frappieri]|uniref:DUF3549 domain-containing protein n=1 Tax=Methylophaga frappieri (strain ATCC BAA-2434 / DSM 25690 / JAM7) TaxID=754477 RepID=I1YGI3_METFJ|nr:DUF3549 family protein [Methylophaga frappieri]AFJ02026.1 Protein of unknown function (DUF3549) [Methylophaga frappieri]
MAQQKISTLTSFFEQSGTKYRIFDMGRRVSKISSTDFARIENAALPYPMPFQRMAWLAIVFWAPGRPDQHYVWFLQLPLDEQGLLLQVARDEFLVAVLDRVGESMLAAADGHRLQGALKDSPYSFTPREEKMAAFNALATATLRLPPSPYFPAAKAYFTGNADSQVWSELALQGVADVAVRLPETDDVADLIQTLPGLPATPFQTLARFLEQVAIPTSLVEAFIAQLSAALGEVDPDVNHVAACLRAISNTAAQGLVAETVRKVLQHDCSRNVEILAVVSGRCWSTLAEPTIAHLFCERLAINDAGQPGFSQLLADVLYLPNLRDPIMQALRSPGRSDALATSVGIMFGQSA